MVKHDLDRARKDLIETGLRNNPLINFKLHKAKGVAVVGGDAATLYSTLVNEDKSISFVPDSYRGTRLALHTPYDSDLLQKRLLKTQYDARAFVEERGVNVLYLALGMMHWYEEPSSKAELCAPLILVPVLLTRSTATETFSIKYSNEDVEGNLPLAARMSELGLELPELGDQDVINVDEYFNRVESAIKRQRTWAVQRDEIVLSLFSFANTFMYRDLQPDAWFTEQNPEGSPLISSILTNGFRNDGPSIAEDEYLDKHIAPNVLRQVVDADSSQALAMLDVQKGRNLIIQGPPGTGKSQTITNIIADAVASGKKVLFVAEKSAALDVVKRRLTKVGLGDLCLELHSHSANKKSILQELRRTHELGRPKPSVSWSLENYKTYRDGLNAYCLAINTPIEGTSWTPQQLMGLLAGVRARSGSSPIPDASVPPQDVRWTHAAYEHKLHIVDQTRRLLEEIGLPKHNPFVHSRLRTILPFDQDTLHQRLQEAYACCSALLKDVTSFTHALKRESECSIEEVKAILASARRASTAPELAGMDASAQRLQQASDVTEKLLRTGLRISNLYKQYANVVHDHAWETDCSEMARVYEEKGGSWFRWLSAEYRQARSACDALIAHGQKYGVAARRQMLRDIITYQQGRAEIDSASVDAKALLGPYWQGMRTAWEDASSKIAWINEFMSSQQTHARDVAMLGYLTSGPNMTADVRAREQAISTNVSALRQHLEAICHRLDMADQDADALKGATLQQIAATMRAMVESMSSLQLMTRWNTMKEAARQEGMSWFTKLIEEHNVPTERLADVFAYNVLTPLLRAVRSERPLIESADGNTLVAQRSQFQKLDVSSFTVTRDELLNLHFAGIPQFTDQGQVGILAKEYNKKQRHMPIRKLMEQTHAVIQAMKPVFMMSPKSIAAFLPPHTVTFDLVVFDEASQIRPVDAFGALMRGRQIVVVGDTKQLPPTNFFNRVLEEEDLDESEETATSDIESLLSLAASKGVPQRMLRWHYRSRHHSLIALSNHLFYDDRLIVFPSPQGIRQDLGLVFHHMPHSVYDRGKSRTNAIEAAAVAESVLEHVRTRPEKTLGIATFNMQQADKIMSELELLRKQNADLDIFMQAHPDEPFFCKSLENVQGDERDVIFISVGYGRDSGGVLSMSFGAINKDGGERRLNVLITRARESCHVFSNIAHHDIDDSKSKSFGVYALKSFLRFAEQGEIDIPTAGGQDVESPFEEEVARALIARGYDVAYQVGSAGFRIDLAIRDPKNPSNYILGIECDGASYHRSRSARDRDRLRQLVLENIGWQIHRIWSTDWFRSPDHEMRKLIGAIQVATNRVASIDSPKAPIGNVIMQESVASVSREQRTATKSTQNDLVGQPYKLAKLSIRLGGRELADVGVTQMQRWIVSVVDEESPVHMDEVITRIADAAGVKRVGSRIQDLFDQAMFQALQSGDLTKHGAMLYSAGNKTVSVRDRSLLEQSSKHIEKIAPEEIDAAICMVVERTFGINSVEVVQAVAKALGFKRTSEEIQRGISQGLARVRKTGKVIEHNGMLRLS